MIPEFPDFRPIQMEDREEIHGRLWKYQPQTSELTFTNLFIWRFRYAFQWAVYQDWLLILGAVRPNDLFLLAPIGPPSRSEVVRIVLTWLKETKRMAEPRIERADGRLIGELTDEFLVEPARDQFDYVYRHEDLVNLAGRKYHAKRNHITKFRGSHPFHYVPLDSGHLKACLDLSESWCGIRRCEEDLSLMEEWGAVQEALNHFESLQVRGGAIVMGDKIEAFALGEMLNATTAVVHIEKANPEIQGLYAVINQQFCERAFPDASFVNREQDLGTPGLRQAKLSYYPDHLVEKFQMRLR